MFVQKPSHFFFLQKLGQGLTMLSPVVKASRVHFQSFEVLFSIKG